MRFLNGQWKKSLGFNKVAQHFRILGDFKGAHCATGTRTEQMHRFGPDTHVYMDSNALFNDQQISQSAPADLRLPPKVPRIGK